MKKYILATILTVAFSINSNAQESKIVEETPISQVSIYDTKATSDINDIKPYVKLTADLEKNLHGLFRAKHKNIYLKKEVTISNRLYKRGGKA